ncbi:hypothetical protein ACQ4M3_12920 [Leptolyngbya sp. AN03gr2]|uniref:hypothetical protein n=1 Tax=unclassified Leptolyngbya TaxID=2650499 RepID=UPI003D31AD58
MARIKHWEDCHSSVLLGRGDLQWILGEPQVVDRTAISELLSGQAEISISQLANKLDQTALQERFLSSLEFKKWELVNQQRKKCDVVLDRLVKAFFSDFLPIVSLEYLRSLDSLELTQNLDFWVRTIFLRLIVKQNFSTQGQVENLLDRYFCRDFVTVSILEELGVLSEPG